MFRKAFYSKLFVVIVASLGVGSTGVALAHEGSKHADDVEAPLPALSDAEKQVVAALENYAAAVQSGKLDEVDQHVIASDAFTSLEGDAYLDRGWQNYRKHLGEKLSSIRDYTYTFSNIQPVVHGDLAYATMDYALTFSINSDQFKSGEGRFTMQGKATMVLSKSDDEWKIQHRHITRDKS